MSTNMEPYDPIILADMREDPGSAHHRRWSICGERVRLPDGRTGKVVMLERTREATGIIAVIEIEGAKPWLFGLINPRPVRFTDEAIDTLEIIPTEAEIQAILDDPEALGLDP